MKPGCAVISKISVAVFLLTFVTKLETASIRRFLPTGHSVGTTVPGSRIISGSETKAGEFPWMVSLQRNGFFGRHHFCAGSIIRANSILTAAHCVEGLHASAVWAVAGEHKLDEVSGKEQQLAGYKITIHQDYDRATLKNDIAIIRLAGNFTLGKFVKTAKLPNPSLDVKPGNELVVAGWGTITEGGNLSNIMRKATVPAISDTDCSLLYGKENIDDATMLCAGYANGGQDSCQGDSGGQLMQSDRALVGIVSWGYGCGQPNYPGVYTEVAHFRLWVSQHLS